MTAHPALVENIRCASRTMVRELGFMHATLAATDHSPSAIHTLLEIEAHTALSATQLTQLLGLDKSSVSRMVAKLITVGELQEMASADGRVKQLQLSEQGKRTVAQIHVYGRMQVNTAMAYLNAEQQQTVANGLATYADALKACRTGEDKTPSPSVEIIAGYRPGIVGRITEMHAEFYSRHSGFGQFFERQVATGVAEFVGRLGRPGNAIWIALLNGRIVGSIAIDGEDLGNNEAHLRWFILDESCRGSGVGRQLLRDAVEFCDRSGLAVIQLWTFKGLEVARRLYEASGFELTHEQQGNQWGATVIEQQFTRYLPRTPDVTSPQQPDS